MSPGLTGADADAIVIMDGDLQDPPELIPDMVLRWDTAGGSTQVVRAIRRSRRDTGVRGVRFRAFHRLHRWVGDVPEAADVSVYCLLDRRG
jgi:dolichol-phosphate mannosyltransferase